MNNNTPRGLMQLPADLLKHIVILIAMSCDGAKNIAKVLLISRGLRELALSTEVLGALSFGDELSSTEFWNSDGLIVKSARAGNLQSHGEIMTRIRVKIDAAHRELDFAIRALEDYNAKVERRVSAMLGNGSNYDEIKIINLIAGHTLKQTNLDIQKVELMINAYGRPFFKDQCLLVRFDGLKPKYRKFSTDLSLLMEEPDDV